VPQLAVSCYENGTSFWNANPAIVSFAWMNDGKPIMFGGTAPDPVKDAALNEVGRYPVAPEANGDPMELSVDEAGSVVIGGFSTTDLRVVDVTDPDLAAPLANVSLNIGTTTEATFFAEAGHRYLILETSHALRSTPVPGPRTLLLDDRGAEYLVVAPAHLMASAQRLADYRAAQGLVTRVLSLQEVYDSFSGGQSNPWALRQLLEHANDFWQPKPRYLVLVGNGTFEGAYLLNYSGHGGLDRLAAEGLLVSSDVASLETTGRLPIVSALTCTIGRFEVPRFAALGSTLVTTADRGAIAVFSPTGLSVHVDAARLNEHFFEAMFSGDNPTLGEAVNEALRRYSEEGPMRHHLDIYNLLGDPALLLPQNNDPGVPSTLFADGFETGDTSAWR
jgi:hypothetical protein